jgi:hypothetical protein
VTGALTVRAVAAQIDELVGKLGEWITVPIAGLASFGFDVDRRGRVARVQVLSDTTRVPARDERERRRIVRKIRDAIAGWRFGTQRGTSRVTLPLVFER